MLIQQLPVTKRVVPKWLWILAAVIVAGIATLVVILATHWPFTREAITRALESASGRQVVVGTFTNSYFPPGCVAGDIRFLRHIHKEEPPMITVQKLEIQGSFAGMFSSPNRLSAVRVSGMHMRIPPKRSEGGDNPVLLDSGPGGKKLAISKVTADGTVLEFISGDRDKEPYVLRVDRLAITGVGSGGPLSYRATLTNSEPPGVIQSEGKFGPWNPDDIASTALSGTYTYDNIDLGVFRGIKGIGSARGKFDGPLSHIQTTGGVDVAGFQVDGSDHKVQLATTFDAIVNGTNGDVTLNPAVARYRRTEIQVRGSIAARADQDGKTAAFDVSVPKGRVDDLLFLFDSGPPGMSGSVSARGKFVWPPGPRKFVEKIAMELAFGMEGGRFTAPGTQETINRVSESAQGESKKEQDEDPQTVLSKIRGQIRLKGGVASIANAAFTVPGADADLRGTYGLVDHRVDLHGTLDTRGHLSDATTGLKALVLKAITPLFKKKGKVRIVPFQITGAYGDTSVTIDWKQR